MTYSLYIIRQSKIHQQQIQSQSNHAIELKTTIQSHQINSPHRRLCFHIWQRENTGFQSTLSFEYFFLKKKLGCRCLMTFQIHKKLKGNMNNKNCFFSPFYKPVYKIGGKCWFLFACLLEPLSALPLQLNFKSGTILTGLKELTFLIYRFPSMCEQIGTSNIGTRKVYSNIEFGGRDNQGRLGGKTTV